MLPTTFQGNQKQPLKNYDRSLELKLENSEVQGAEQLTTIPQVEKVMRVANTVRSDMN